MDPPSQPDDSGSALFPSMDKSIIIEWQALCHTILFMLFWEILYRAGRKIMTATCHHITPDNKFHPTLIDVGPAYLVSSVNAVICVVRGTVGFFLLRKLPIEAAMCGFNTALVLPDAPIEYLPLVQHAFLTSKIFFGYVLYDLIHLVKDYPKFGGMDMVFHHIVFLGGVYLGVASKALVLPFCWLIFTELSTLFLNARWFLIKTGNGESPMMGPVSMMFAATFFIARVVIYGIGTIHFGLNIPLLQRCTHPVVGPTVFFIIFIGQIMNLLWFYKIAQIAMRGGKKAEKSTPSVDAKVDAKVD